MNIFIYFHQYIALSSRAEDGHQMYSGGSVVSEASMIDPEFPLNFTGVKKCEIWRHFRHRSTLSRPRLKMQQNILILKQTC